MEEEIGQIKTMQLMFQELLEQNLIIEKVFVVLHQMLNYMGWMLIQIL